MKIQVRLDTGEGFFISPGESWTVEIPRSVEDPQLGRQNYTFSVALFQPATNQLIIILREKKSEIKTMQVILRKPLPQLLWSSSLPCL